MKSANNKNSGGNQMSLFKSASRRLSLLAGSSVLAASLSAMGSLGVAMVPTAAYAIDECAPAAGSGTQTDGVGGTSDPTLNGSAADTFECTATTYATGITYGSSGALTVRKTNTGTTTVTANGVNLSGAGADAVTWTSTAGGVTGGTTTNGPVIEALSGSGAITVNTAGVTGSNATITHGIRAVSNGGGAVNVTATGSVSATSTTGDGVTAGGTAAIEAVSTGGNGAVSVTSSSASGRLYGILAQASGTGALTINTGTSTASANSTTGLAGIRATTGTGLLTINAIGSGGAGTGVLINAGGDVVFTGRASGTQYGIDIGNVAAGTTTTLNLVGTRSNFSGSVTGTTGGIAAIRAQGAGTVLVNIVGSQAAMNFNFTGMSAPVEVNVLDGSAWAPVGNTSTVVPAGNFSINIASGGAMIAGAHNTNGTILEAPTVITFSDPEMVLNNAGYIIVGPDDISTGHQFARHEAELQLIGLGQFHHSGTILLGGTGYPGTGLQIQGVKVEDTDSWYDDILVFQNGVWIGEGGVVVFDVDTNRTQTNCTREAVTFDLSAADCLRIVNSTVEGQTLLRINQTYSGDRGRLTQQIMDDGILLVDAPGSTVAAENFALDPGMRGYNPDSQSLDKGLYQYVLLFDEEASQFKLFGTLSGAAYQLPIAATAAHNLWRLSTGSWLNRQADLRGGIGDGVGGGIWMRASGDQTERDVTGLSTLGGLPFSVDSSHRQDTYAVTGGVDVLTASDGDRAYVVGLMAGYAHTDIEYDASANTQAMDAWTGGLYAGLVIGGLFVDATVSANNVIIDTDAPGFDLLPEGTILSSRLVSLGGQVEAGWRLPFSGGLFAEPLASVSYVRSKMDDLDIKPDDYSRPGLEVSFEDPSSLRAGVGGRLGLERLFLGMRTEVSVLGRVWTDLEGQNTASIHNLAFPDDPDIRVTDDFSGRFNEVAVGGSVYSPNGIVSGFLNLGGKFGDDYQAKTGSMGVRVAW